jgi:hypothetical protein
MEEVSHMFDKVIIIDESQTQPQTVVLNNNRPTAFFPIFSSRGFGKDSQLKLFQGKSQSSLVSAYGTPNLADTLAPLYYAYEFLRGGGDAYIRRITSATSTYAHAVIVAKGRPQTADPLKYEVKFGIQTVATATDLEALLTDAEALISLTVDVDGYKTYPIAVVGLNWTGSEGNKYTFRLLPDKGVEKVIDARGYQMEVRKTTNGVPATVSFSTDENAMIEGSTIFANEYVEEQLPDVFFQMLSAGYAKFLADTKTFLPAGETYPDVFFGKANDTGVVYPSYSIQGSGTDFTAVGGVPFAGGDDGDFVSTNATRIDNMMTRLVSSFAEIPTLLMVNEYKYPIDFVYDFGATQEVKDAIVGFANSRKTTKAIIDTGILKTTTGILAARKSGSLNYNTENVAIVAGVATARDQFTNKKMVMPLSFFEAFATPNHINTFGGERPFAGNLYSYPNMMPGTYQPYFYDENADIVTEFIDNRLNFAMEDANQYTSMHQSTSLNLSSSLGERNNVYLLHRLIRVGLRTAKDQRWNFAEDSDIAQYQSTLIQNIGNELEGKLGDFSLTAQREGTIGDAKNRVLVIGTIRFKYLNKGTTFRFTVV